MARVSHESEFREHLQGLASTERYIRFLHDVAITTGRDVTPRSLRSDRDIEIFASGLADTYADKSIANYRSVMRRYVEMVSARGL